MSGQGKVTWLLDLCTTPNLIKFQKSIYRMILKAHPNPNSNYIGIMVYAIVIHIRN